MNRFPAILMMLISVSAISIPIISHAATQQAPADQSTLQQALSLLDQYKTLQNSLKIQTADVAYGMKKALIMADLLIDSDGTLNINLCPSLKRSFIPSEPEEYEVRMEKVLDQLDISWQSFFTNITAPQDSTHVGNIALRALFTLKSTDTITDRHAKVAVLSALLSPYNQGPVGDCFAVCDVIRDHDEYYRHAAQDYQSTIMQGFIERPVDNALDYFFFLPALADDDRNQSFNLTASGTFPNTNYALFDAPGFSAARDLMGGHTIANLTKTVMQTLSSNASRGLVKITPSQVIAAIAQAINAQNPNTNISDLCALGNYAFSCLTNHSVLRGVEAAFAAMAEDRARDSTRGNINDCVAQALNDTWTSLQQMQGLSQFQQTFTTAFNASYRLLYNLDIPLAQVSSDGSSTDGGFQLYQRIPETPSVLGNRVATPQAFRTLILNAISTTLKQLGSTSQAQAIATRVASVVNTDAFLKNALWTYDQSNQHEPDPIQNYQKLSRTPMQSCDGDNPFEVDDLDTEVTYDNNVQNYTPKNTTDLISWCLNLAKKTTADMTPMDSPQHAFNFMPKNPDLASFVKNNVNARKWIKQILITPGMQVARQKITSATQQAVGTTMYNFISSALSNSTSYQQLVQSLAKQNLNVQSYAKKLLNGINKLLGSDQNQASEIALMLDAVLIENLPANSQAIITKSAIRFAFTNWNQGTKNIYFCAFFNPRTEQVSFGSILEDKTNLQPMDESAWVNHQQWDVDITPAAPVTTTN